MIFNIYQDTGDFIRGTVIPASFSAIPRILVFDHEQIVAEVTANEFNQAVKDIGQHETGVVNFSISDTEVPGLAGRTGIELVDADTNVRIYRRFQPGMLKDKFFRLETQLLPVWRLDAAVENRFQQHHRGLETQGRSFAMQVFNLSQDSIYLSGRLLMKNYMFCFEMGYKVIVLLRDPFEELAERLLVLRKVENTQLNILGDRDYLRLRDVTLFASSLDLNDERALKRAIRSMPEDVAKALSKPLLQQFSAVDYDSDPAESNIAATLDILAESAVVGLRSHSQQFFNLIGDIFGIEKSSAAYLNDIPHVNELAAILRETRLCQLILEKDCEIYYHVEQAYQKAASALITS